MLKSRFMQGALVVALSSLGMLTGCDGFFNDPATTSTTATSSTGDYIYVVNSTANTLSEFTVASGGITAISGSPLTLETGLTASSVTVSRSNSFVYVGGNGAIDCFSIGSTGALTAVAAGRATAVANFTSLDTSQDGKWLLALDSTGLAVYVFGINTSTGALTPLPAVSLNISAASALTRPRVRINSTETSVLAALNGAGTAAYSFNATNGVLTYLGNVTGNTTGNTYFDNSVAFDSTGGYAFVARSNTGAGTSGITSYSVATSGAITQIQALAPSGAAPSALTFDSSGTYLYTSNTGDQTLTGFTDAAGTLSAVASGPYASGVKVVALTRDNSGKYIVGIGSTGSSDVVLYSQDPFSAGKLNAAATASTGSQGAVSVAATRTSAGL